MNVSENSTLKDLNRLTLVFEGLFRESENTRLVGGAPEPLYSPGGDSCTPNRIIYTLDYFSSALHEIAHWCVAGKERRKLEDYGYWYAPDGRNAEQQQLFERVEVKPQALEWIFTKAVGRRFKVSADNLNADFGASLEFKQNVLAQVQRYCEGAIPQRAKAFAEALAEEFSQNNPFEPSSYSLKELDAWY